MLAQAIRNNFDDIKIEVAQDVEEYELQESDIVENPREVVVQFPIISEFQLEEKLPFFKSIMAKLASY